MPLSGGDDHERALRPIPANCSPAMIIACGRDNSFSMHSATMRRATRFVDARRGTTARDSMVLSRSTMRRVSSWIIAVSWSRGCEVSQRIHHETTRPRNHETSLILHQLLDSRSQFQVSRLRLLHHRGWCVLHELRVRQLCLEGGELFSALFDLALRSFDLLFADYFLRELDGDGKAFDDVVMRLAGRLSVDHQL